jgi:pyruvate carboxylase
MEKRETAKLNIDQTLYTTRISQRYSKRTPYTPPVAGLISSFIPGTVVEVLVSVGDQVVEGDDIVIIEAMKMKNRLKSHVTGRVLSVNTKKGDRVAKGVTLVEIGL